jgi:hypothetical protein
MEPFIALFAAIVLLLSLAFGAVELGADSRPQFDDRPMWW